jgi:hypothetical protein
MTDDAPALTTRSPYHRPYARKRGIEPSVTTVLDSMMGTPGLSWAAARVTAVQAVETGYWRGLPEAEAIEHLRFWHRRFWNGRAAMGTLIHLINQAWIDGHTVDLGALVNLFAAEEPDAAIWAGREQAVADYAALYIKGLEGFWLDFQPVTLGTEVVVRTPGVYIGQLDWHVLMGGYRWILDIKTTAQEDPDKGIYLKEWMLQLAAYNFAEEAVEYELGPDGRPIETGTVPWPPAQRFGVIHLRGDGLYELIEIPPEEALAAHPRFIEMAITHQWFKTLGKKPRVVQPPQPKEFHA